jgi:hypothetical protein
MSAALTDKQRQQLAVTILAAVLLLIFGAIVLPLWFANASRQENIQLLQERLVRLQQMTDENVSLGPRLERLKREEINNGHYLKGNTETVAAAELQRLVKSIATQNQVSVTSTQILPAIAESNFVRIGLKVRVRGSMRGLVESIYDIETDKSFLFLDKLVLRDVSRRRTRVDTAGKPFDAEFELAGYAYMPGDE